MTREEALRALTSDSSHDRFKAARFLTRFSIPADLEKLRAAQRKETDTYVRNQLDIAIQSRPQEPSEQPQENPEQVEPYKVDKHVRAQAIDWIAGILLHEIGAKLGLVALSARKEIAAYDDSKTKRHIRNFQITFDSIAELRKATSTPQFEEFDLGELIDEISEYENSESPINISLVGMRPNIVRGSKQLLHLALCNGIRNAIEACKSSNDGESSIEDADVTITWGSTDIEYWIAILDNGPGLTASAESSFELGSSTKKGHPGFGLPIAEQAMQSLNGKISLTNLPEGKGARYEVRWSLKK